MIRNYFKIAIRNLWKNKAYSAINIFGLACGLAVCLLITLYVVDELSYDRYNKNANRIYRVDADLKFGGNELRLAVASDPMGAALKKDYPQVEEYVRFYTSNGSKLVKKGNVFIEEGRVAHADSTLFDVFTLPAIAGNPKTALNEPNTVVLTESTAKKYFGGSNAVGKTIEADRVPYKVTAVIKDIPHNSHFNFDFIFSMDNLDYPYGNYLSMNFQTYILLKEGTDYKAFEKNFAQIINKYILPQAKQFMQIKSMDDFYKAGNKLDFSLMPLTEIHLHSDRTPELGINGNIQYVYIFSAVALFILLIACINFMNLSTARSASRAKEVGIRKVLGSERKNLIGQFLAESTAMAIISMVVAIVVAYFTLPFLNDISGKTLLFDNVLSVQIFPLLLALPVIVGILAGSYPAFYLSNFKPVAVLNGKASPGFKKDRLRSGLVIFQFFMSILFIIGTVVIYKQLNYIQTTSLGFNKDQVLIINGTGALGNNIESFKNEVLRMPGVSGGTLSSFLPVTSARTDNSFSKDAVMDPENALSMQAWDVDYDYVKTLGMKIIKGRDFSKDFGSDSTGIILNETAVKVLGYDDPIGKKIYTNFQTATSNDLISYTIIGVVQNFHYESLKQNIFPLGLRLNRFQAGLASFKVSSDNMQSLVKQVEAKWKGMVPAMPFSYRFMDETFDSMYRAEERVGQLAIAFSVLAIFIACLGLFGLITYMAEQRRKEIGIRKVLGASVSNIIGLLSKDFLKLVLVANLIAWPTAWWVMNKWLEDFTYRTNIGWWMFVAAGMLTVVIAVLTVGFQAFKAAIANPVSSLKME